MITIKYDDGMPIWHGSKAVLNYFDPYMQTSDNINDSISFGCGDNKESQWPFLPSQHDFKAKEWKIMIAGFKHFGIELQTTKEAQ